MFDRVSKGNSIIRHIEYKIVDMLINVMLNDVFITTKRLIRSISLGGIK